jgi:HEAT repeat protein
VEGPGPDEALVAALDDADLWVRYFAAASLGARRDVNARQALARTAAEDSAGPVRIAAVRALGELDPDWTLQVAEQLVLEDDDDVACGALSAIGTAEGARADELLAEAVKSASSPRRRCAIDILAGRRTLAAAEALAWAARLTDEPELAARATIGLSAVAGRSDAAREAAIGTLLDLGQDPQRRDDAVSALARLSGDSIRLVAGALSAESVAIRTTAVEALARMRHPQASASLAAALRDADGSVRAAAVAGFGRLGTMAVADAVAAMRDGDPDPLVRRRAAAVCQRHGWSV